MAKVYRYIYQSHGSYGKLGGGFKDFLFSPLLEEMIQFDEDTFHMRWDHQLGNYVGLKPPMSFQFQGCEDTPGLELMQRLTQAPCVCERLPRWWSIPLVHNEKEPVSRPWHVVAFKMSMRTISIGIPIFHGNPQLSFLRVMTPYFEGSKGLWRQCRVWYGSANLRCDWGCETLKVSSCFILQKW